MRILMTGAAGFIGRVVTRELGAAGHELTLVAHRSPVPADVGAHRVLRGDVRDADFLCDVVRSSEPERVCHLAALTGLRDSESRVMDYFDVNVGGMISLLTAIQTLDHNPVVVFASSRAVYADGDGRAIREDHDTTPRSPYGLSKLLCERLLTCSGLSAWTLRCFNVSGGVDGIVDRDSDRLIPRLLAAAQGEVAPPTIESPDAALDYSHVADVARAFRFALESEPVSGQHRIVNVGSGVPTPTRVVLRGLERALGRAIPAVVASTPSNVGPSDVTVADISRIRALLGWHPLHDMTDILTDAVPNEEEST